MQGCSFHARHELYRSGFADVEDQAVDDLVPEIPVGHLASLEAQRRFDFVTISEEANSLILFRLIVVFVDRDGELYFLDRDDLLLLAGSAIALVLLVQEFSVILNFADWRYGIWGDLDQIERALASHLQGFKWHHDTELLAVFVNYTHFSGADSFVCSDEGFRRALINRGNKKPPQRSLRDAMYWMLMMCGKITHGVCRRKEYSIRPRMPTAILRWLRGDDSPRIRWISHVGLET